MTATTSVVVPVRNGERFLGETLESITSQSRPAEEVIVVDDGSTDRSRDVARSFGPTVRLIEQPMGGPGAARNTGIRASTGTIVALCDADDLWHPAKLERQLALVDNPEKPLAVFCAISEFESPGIDLTAAGVRVPNRLRSGVRLCSALLATRAAIAAVGWFSTDSAVEWVEWSIRLADSGIPILHHPDVLVRRRLHDRNRSAHADERSSDLAGALARHLATKRERRP